MEFIFEGKSLKSGTYQIRNKINGRRYFGSAKRFKSRWKSHESSLIKGTHHNKFLQNDFNKCGTDAFIFEVLEVVESGEQSDRLFVEQKYLDQFVGNRDLCYNFAKTAQGNEDAFSKNPEETRRKLSEGMKKVWQSEKHRELVSKKCSEAAINQWKDIDTREKMLEAINKSSEKLRGKSWGKHSEETKAKISKAHVGLSEPYKGKKLSKVQKENCSNHLRSMISYDKRLSELRKSLCKKIIASNELNCLEFDSINEAAKYFNISRSTIRLSIQKNRPSKNSWTFHLKISV